MKKTVSAMIGKGSVAHNNRDFIAENVDESRTHLNVTYCNENIEDVYHEMFDDALKRYNGRQTRDDRKIDDYYEKIRRGKQEKTFHEVIFQIGNKDDTPSNSPEGEAAKNILDEYYRGFVERNKTLRVFSAHIHMDEATPHIHIDFIPFITGSKRGLDTRVSLKLALAELGFVGGSKHDTEWNQWVNAEKEELTKVMERYNVKRLDKGEHREHLSVYDFKCEQRKEEVKALDNEIDGLKEEKANAEKELSDVEKETSEAKNRLSELEKEEKELSTSEYTYRNSDEYKLPKKGALQSYKSYFEEKLKPFIEKLISVICALCRTVQKLEKRASELIFDRDKYIARYRSVKDTLEQYRKKAYKFDKITSELGDKKVNEIIDRYDKKQEQPAEREYMQRQNGRSRGDYDISR